MHARAEEGLARVDRTAQSRTTDARSRFGMNSVVADRRGELVREAMLIVEKP